MQVSTLSPQLKLRSQLVDSNRHATSVPYGHLFIDLSPRTDNRLGFSTNTGSIPSDFIIADRLKFSNSSADEHTKSLYSPSVPINFPEMQKSLFLQSFPSKNFFRFFCECIVNLLKGNLQSVKRPQVTKFQNEVWFVSQNNITSQQRRDVLASEKDLQLIKVKTPPVINHLS